jgi:hypothetical protein
MGADDGSPVSALPSACAIPEDQPSADRGAGGPAARRPGGWIVVTDSRCCS